MNTPRTTGSTKKLIMWYKIKELFSKGQSYSQISRNLGIDRHRVSQYARMSEEEFLSSEAYCRSYTHKMDAYESFVLNELRSCPSYSSKQIEDHLKVYFFVMVLSRSRYKYVWFSTKPFNTAMTVYAHELAFRYYGGRPKKVLYDQDKVLLHDENLGDLILTKCFRAFVDQQHFEPVFCRKSDPESKGKVENVVKYVKQNFLKGRLFTNADHLNEDCLAWLDRTGNGTMHHGIYRIPKDVFNEEQEYLQPYYGTPVAPQVEMKEYSVRKDNTISYHCSYYTVPSGTYKNAGTRVMVEEQEGHLHIYSKETGKRIANHPLSEVKGVLVQDPAHKTVRGAGITDKELTIHGYIGDIEALDLFLAGISQSKPAYYSRNLSYIIHQMYGYKPEVLHEALVRCLTSKAYNARMLIEASESIRVSKGMSAIPQSQTTNISRELSNIRPERTSINSFEQYFK